MATLTGLNGGQVSALKRAWENMDLLQSLSNTVYSGDRETQEEALEAAEKFAGLCERYGVESDAAYWHCHDLVHDLVNPN